MTLMDELAQVLSTVSNGAPPMEFEIINDGRTLRMTDRETNEIQAQFTVMDDANFLDMTLPQVLTVVLTQLEEGVGLSASPDNPAIFASQITLPAKE